MHTAVAEKRTAVRAPLWGVLGGMGPLASAEFLGTVYRAASRRGLSEQERPRLVLVSDPDIPDRTEVLAGGRPADFRLLADRCRAGLAALDRVGARPVILCCYTAHAVLDALPGDLRAGVVPLPAVVRRELATRPGDALLLASTGALRSGVFRATDGLRHLRAADQDRLQTLLYRLKGGAGVYSQLPALEDIVCGYRPTRVVFGCTELHLFTAAADRGELVLPFDAVDALTTLAGLICDSRAAPAIPRW